MCVADATRAAGCAESRPVVGFEGSYEATADGRIINLKLGGKVLKGNSFREGEGRKVTLNGSYFRLVADLVATAFLENPYGIAHATHLNGDVLDDRVENLSWGPEPLVEDGEVERWADLDPLPYIATSCGRIISKAKGGLIDQFSNHGATRKVTMHPGGSTRLVADLVAEGFGLPNPHGLGHVLHRNGDSLDARLKNLTYLPDELDDSVRAGEEWRPLTAESGQRLLVSSEGRFIDVLHARFLTGDADGVKIILSDRRYAKKADLVAEAFGLPGVDGVLRPLHRNGDVLDNRLANLTFDPAEVEGMEGEWRPVPGYRGLYLLGECGVFLRLGSRLGDSFERGIRRDSEERATQKALADSSGHKTFKEIADWMALTFPDLIGENPLGAARPWHVDGDPGNNRVSNLSWLPGPSPMWPDEEERWAPAPGLEGSHIVSALGRVANLLVGSILEPGIAPDGGLEVDVSRGFGRRQYKIDRLVAEAFLGEPGGRPYLVHINGDPYDNRASNLDWADERVPAAGTPDAMRARHHGAGTRAREAYLEGMLRETYIHRELSRSRAARQRCLELKGTACCVCGVDVKEVYGAAVAPDVHHLYPLCEGYGVRETSPERDLVPVCPNCHRALHSKPGGHFACYTPEEMRRIMRGRGAVA